MRTAWLSCCSTPPALRIAGHTLSIPETTYSASVRRTYLTGDVSFHRKSGVPRGIYAFGFRFVKR